MWCSARRLSSLSTAPSSLLTALASPCALDAPLHAALQAYLASPAPAQEAALASLHAACAPDPAAPLARAAAASPRALPFLASVRQRCSAAEGGSGAPWARDVDAAALRVLRPLYGPALTPLQQLLPQGGAPWMRTLVAGAQRADTVRPARDAHDFHLKFGWRRLVYGLHHAAQPEELLAVLYAALLPGMPSGLAALDAQSGGAGPGRTRELPPARALPWALAHAAAGPGREAWEGSARTPPLPPPTTAAFYSVGSPAAIARGLRLGTRIIYALAGALAGEPALAAHPLTTFCTLSPVPGFVPWLQALAAGSGAPGGPALHAALWASQAQGVEEALGCARTAGAPRAAAGLLARLAQPAWWGSPAHPHLPLRALAGAALRVYLLDCAADARGGALCKVAAFHLGNGARLGRMCGGADPSALGLARSAGFLVNYVYSETGAAGLQATQQVQAGRYAGSPASVRAEQAPGLVWGEDGADVSMLGARE
jgi:hypothetical protein